MLRILDFVLAAIGLFLAAILLPVLCLAIRTDSPGAAIFKQVRVGRDGRPFTCFKLRTMAAGTRQGASHEVGAATITGIGALLRRTKLDELPQLWNVLVGEMSLVGPRPCLPSQSELIREREIRGVNALRPGITGTGQIAGLDMSTPRRLAMADASWLEQRSVTAYAGVLLSTLTGKGQGDAAAHYAARTMRTEPLR